jgi:hypothetical protein
VTGTNGHPVADDGDDGHADPILAVYLGHDGVATTAGCACLDFEDAATMLRKLADHMDGRAATGGNE